MNTTASSPIQLEIDEGVATFTLNRPERMNALNFDLLSEWREALKTVTQDTAVRVMILTGNGKHFCTGGDLKDPSKGPTGEMRLSIMHDCLRLLLRAPQPVIAAVEGNAYGAGLSYVVASDVVVAGQSAKFCAPFTGVGLVPDTGLAYTLPRRVGAGRARQMMFQGLVLTAEQARQWGVVEDVVEDGQALPRARTLAAGMALRAPLAMRGLRQLLQQEYAGLEASLTEELDIQQRLIATDDVKEARAAFTEKRRPHFQGR